MDRKNLLRKDLRHSWHPYTQMSTLVTEPPTLIDRAEGLFLFDAEGNRYYDAISSWWCVVHGHGHPRIREAVARQMERLDHVLFAGVTHEPAVRLASRLAAIAPEGLSRVFFSDNGSTAVEVALKMSLQCLAQPRAGGADRVRLSRSRIPRGHHRVHERQRRRSVPSRVPADPVPRPPGCLAVLLPLPGGEDVSRSAGSRASTPSTTRCGKAAKRSRR